MGNAEWRVICEMSLDSCSSEVSLLTSRSHVAIKNWQGVKLSLYGSHYMDLSETKSK